MLSTTTKLFAGAMALAACLIPARSWAGVESALPLVLSAASLGDDGRSAVTQADELLKAARKAMSDGNYDVADSKIATAEKLQPKYPPIHIGDTPKKARTDLDKLMAKRAAAGDANVKAAMAKPDRATGQLPLDPFQARQATPSSQTAASGGHPPANIASQGTPDPSTAAYANQVPPSTPVVGIRTSGGAIMESPVAGLQVPGGSGSRSIRSLAEPEGPNPWDVDGPPAGAASVTAGSPNQNISRGALPAADTVSQNQNLSRAQSDAMLLDARRMLSRGDARGAQMNVDQAKGLGVNYSPMDDSPAKVEDLIRKFTALPSPTAADSEGARRRRAEVWMEEAEGLARWREYNEAERLAKETQRMGINYSPFEAKPEQLLSRVAEARQMAGPASGSHPLIPGSPDKQRATDLARQARLAMAQGDLAAAEQMARQGETLAPDTAFGPSEDRPALVLLDIQRAITGRFPVSRAGGATITDPSRYPVSSAVYDPANDRTQNIAANSTAGSLPSLTQPTPDGGTGEAMRSYRLGMEAAARYNRDEALANFRRAYAFQMELDSQTRKSLYDELKKLGDPVDSSSMPGAGAPALSAASKPQAWDRLPLGSTAPVSANYSPSSPMAAPGLISPGAIAATTPPPAVAAIPSPLENVPSPTPSATSGQALARQVANEVARQQSLAREMREKQPKQALETLQRTRDMVANVSGLDPGARDQLLRRLDERISELQQYVAKNGPQIDLDERNKKIEQEVDSSRKQKVVVQEKLAYLVNDFNKAIDEQRYADAQLLAKKATELDPDNPVVVQINYMSRMASRMAQNDQIKNNQEDKFDEVMRGVERDTVPFEGPIEMPDAKKWRQLTLTRQGRLREGTQRRSPKELEIAQRLNTPVDAKYQNRPLREVLDGLAKRASVPLYIDPQGLQSEGVSSDAKVTIDLNQDISLKSALNLILEQFHLTYVIKDEVLKITSEDAKRGEVYQVIYPVGDLVIPIPNFAPSGREGINGAFREAYERMGFSGGAAGGAGLGAAGPITLAANEQGAGSSFAANAGVLAQMQQRPGIPIFGSGSTSSGAQQNIPFGPGGLKGGQQADFDSLIELITSTIEQESWTDKGGQGSIEPFNTNLSLVISQTQEVHEKIADLLQQLRRLQDLQVTIEVRFITLEDDFFEKMGIDFDFNIPTATTVPNPPPVAGPPPSYGPLSPSAVIGLDPSGAPTALQDVQFRQGGFSVTPPFGGFDAGSAATFGFAVLSDIQAFFVIQAAQGDTRSNILQAPKVTLFNGQQASIADQTQEPFVTSVIPVVGDFAAALQPVIVVLSQGTSLTVQAVVSNDRRFVRLTVVPFFSQIGDVNTFTFNGSSSTTKKSSDSKSGSSDASTSSDDESSSTGTTVQLPQFSFVTVTTTVSVPDGGTVLLGGIKRLNEGRTERGVPILSKLPYINRLFRNTAIGRETTSLMMMVTPRIIIQEEEEENLLGGPPQP